MAVSIYPVLHIPEVTPGDDLGALIGQGLAASDLSPQDGDILVVTQKIVSKAEGRLVDLSTVTPSPLARQWASATDKDPREVEVVLAESRRIVRMVGRVLIAETRHGFVCANAGVDESNLQPGHACLLPEDPDASAARLRGHFRDRHGIDLAVIISDTFGRPWRVGQTNIAIGLAGMASVADYVGKPDTSGREMRVTALAVPDELAGAAELVMNKVDRVPVALIRGYVYPRGEGRARDLVRPIDQDLFR